MSSDRDRLIELFSPFADGTYNGSGTIVDGTKVDDVVDHLLANDVIVPPCKVGQTVYTILLGEIISYDIASYVVDERVSFVNLAFMQGNKMYGKTVTIKEFYEHYYFTNEEAEKALVTNTNVGSKKERDG